MSRRLQLGVIGSMADLSYGKAAKDFVVELGVEIVKNNYILVFGAEKDSDSLPTITARTVDEIGGIAIAITYDKGLITSYDSATATIATGLVRGGGRELVQALSCDALIAIAGGSGTLNEITVAYQAGIPVVCVIGLGGWSNKLANTYLDNRRRYKFGAALTPKEAICKVKEMLQSREENYGT